MKKRYEVTLNYFVTTTVEASSEEEAIKIAQQEDLSGQLEGCGANVTELGEV